MLDLNVNNFVTKTLTYKNKELKYRAYKDIYYVSNPVDEIQQLNIFVPAAYYDDKQINGYTKQTAPIFMPNTVEGYRPGPRISLDDNNKMFVRESGTICEALLHGYVVVSAGLRGRTQKNTVGQNIGKAPAFIVDLKAAIRYIRHNQDVIAGDTNKIITNGTSAGGATSALAGISGDSNYFEPELKRLGAAAESDAIFAASCYCPIHNLEHADIAYEWQFNGLNEWKRTKIIFPKDGIGKPTFKEITGTLSGEEQELSDLLKQQFIPYLNSLHLKDELNNELTLNDQGRGSFLDYVKNYIKQSAQVATNNGISISPESGVIFEGNRVVDLDWTKYLNFITRMKAVPAFDDLDLTNPEPNLFGDTNCDSKHFTAFSQKYSHVKAVLADQKLVKNINPLSYIKDKTVSQAKYWRIRHGASDRDTSFAIPIILATLLKDNGFNVDFFMPWDVAHSGDYDLADLFAWIDKISKE